MFPRLSVSPLTAFFFASARQSFSFHFVELTASSSQIGA